MRHAWNPTRRNKHIGTGAQGHGNDNRLVIPEAWGDIYYEKLDSHKLIVRHIGLREIRFFIEPARPGFFYPCSIDDISTVLTHCPEDALSSFDFIVLRQATRKQRILRPVWGRAIFSFDIRRLRGAAIVIEAQNLDSYVWPTSLSTERRRELTRLQQDGHAIHRSDRHYRIAPNAQSLRNTILYRTLLHEIGHHVDRQRCSDEEWDGKTTATKEDYAHRFAADLYASLVKQGIVPFAPFFDEARMEQDGIRREWFCAPDDFASQQE
ncbi:hypothetical protein [Undibacterium sp. TJN19]|uniref:hypothetical protein n=1 Tax=Undibacterium sp. TJN19 TaxID=3413055 RepID=UPI003BF0ECFF